MDLLEVAAHLRAGRLVPYLGEGCSAAGTSPRMHAELAAALGQRVALPRRVRGNPWESAQYIESSRHRQTLDKLLTEIFASAVEPTPLHRALAALRLPMIVDTWYDAGMRNALAQTAGADWVEVQGVNRAGIGAARWYRYYDAAGAEIDESTVAAHATLLYKPHGAIQPAGNFLLADSDYVEVLTEIDIQTPIPPPVRARRRDRGLLFIGCRFNDQLLRSYARQVAKHSGGRHVALLADAALTRNELRLLDELQVACVSATPEQLLSALA